jgi:hypothetical protein
LSVRPTTKVARYPAAGIERKLALHTRSLRPAVRRAAACVIEMVGVVLMFVAPGR